MWLPPLPLCYSICVIQDDNAQPLDSHKESIPQTQAAQIALQKPSGGLARASKSVRSTPNKFSAPFSASVATPSSLKAKGKWTHQEAFADKSKAKAEVLNKLVADKHTRKMAEYAQHMAELEIKKQRLDMEAKGKHLEAEECLATAQHQREREKKQHEMEMLRLRLQYQGGGLSGQQGTAAAQFGAESFSAEPFAGPNTFGMGNYLT